LLPRGGNNLDKFVVGLCGCAEHTAENWNVF